MNALTNLLAAMLRSRFSLFIIRRTNRRQIQIGLCVCFILSLSGNILVLFYNQHPPGPAVPASASASAITSSGDSTRTAAADTITTTTSTTATTTTAAAADNPPLVLLRGGGVQVAATNDTIRGRDEENTSQSTVTNQESMSSSTTSSTSTSTSTSMATTNETDETIKKNYRVIDQSNNESESENFLDSCGCPSSCNFWNLMDKNQSMGFLCEERIQFLTKRYKMPRHKACIASANAGYCTLSCHPEVCTPFTPEPFNNTSAIASTKTMTKMIHYILDARTEGQYHTLYDGNQCPDKDRPGFPSTLSQPGQLDFATHITTNLKILVMGDSVGAHQIGQNFMEAATFNMTQTNIDMNKAMTHIHAPGKMPYPNNHVSAIPTRGGGTAMVYRANSGMLSRKLLRDAPMGVSAHHVRGLQQHLHITTGSSSVDAMVLAIPSGWIGFEQQINDAITQETLAESVRWAGEIFGAKVVVLPTVMLSGNLFKDLEGNFFPIRKKIYEFAKYFHSNVNSSSWHGVEQVVVLDLASLSLELVRANAQALGLMKEDDGNKDSNHALQEALLGHTIIKTSKKGDFQVPVALICSEVVSANATTCTKNRFSVDGMHWCMKNGVGGRIQAGLACVLSCAYPNQKQVAGHFSVTDCETDCNNRFMNIHAPTFGEGDLTTSSSA